MSSTDFPCCKVLPDVLNRFDTDVYNNSKANLCDLIYQYQPIKPLTQIRSCLRGEHQSRSFILSRAKTTISNKNKTQEEIINVMTTNGSNNTKGIGTLELLPSNITLCIKTVQNCLNSSTETLLDVFKDHHHEHGLKQLKQKQPNTSENDDSTLLRLSVYLEYGTLNKDFVTFINNEYNLFLRHTLYKIASLAIRETLTRRDLYKIPRITDEQTTVLIQDIPFFKSKREFKITPEQYAFLFKGHLLKSITFTAPQRIAESSSIKPMQSSSFVHDTIKYNIIENDVKNVTYYPSKVCLPSIDAVPILVLRYMRHIPSHTKNNSDVFRRKRLQKYKSQTYHGLVSSVLKRRIKNRLVKALKSSSSLFPCIIGTTVIQTKDFLSNQQHNPVISSFLSTPSLYSSSSSSSSTSSFSSSASSSSFSTGAKSTSDNNDDDYMNLTQNTKPFSSCWTIDPPMSYILLSHSNAAESWKNTHNNNNNNNLSFSNNTLDTSHHQEIISPSYRRNVFSTLWRLRQSLPTNPLLPSLNNLIESAEASFALKGFPISLSHQTFIMGLPLLTHYPNIVVQGEIVLESNFYIDNTVENKSINHLSSSLSKKKLLLQYYCNDLYGGPNLNLPYNPNLPLCWNFLNKNSIDTIKNNSNGDCMPQPFSIQELRQKEAMLMQNEFLRWTLYDYRALQAWRTIFTSPNITTFPPIQHGIQQWFALVSCYYDTYKNIFLQICKFCNDHQPSHSLNSKHSDTIMYHHRNGDLINNILLVQYILVEVSWNEHVHGLALIQIPIRLNVFGTETERQRIICKLTSKNRDDLFNNLISISAQHTHKSATTAATSLSAENGSDDDMITTGWAFFEIATSWQTHPFELHLEITFYELRNLILPQMKDDCICSTLRNKHQTDSTGKGGLIVTVYYPKLTETQYNNNLEHIHKNNKISWVKLTQFSPLDTVLYNLNENRVYDKNHSSFSLWSWNLNQKEPQWVNRFIYNQTLKQKGEKRVVHIPLLFSATHITTTSSHIGQFVSSSKFLTQYNNTPSNGMSSSIDDSILLNTKNELVSSHNNRISTMTNEEEGYCYPLWVACCLVGSPKLLRPWLWMEISGARNFKEYVESNPWFSKTTTSNTKEAQSFQSFWDLVASNIPLKLYSSAVFEQIEDDLIELRNRFNVPSTSTTFLNAWRNILRGLVLYSFYLEQQCKEDQKKCCNEEIQNSINVLEIQQQHKVQSKSKNQAQPIRTMIQKPICYSRSLAIIAYYLLLEQQRLGCGIVTTFDFKIPFYILYALCGLTYKNKNNNCTSDEIEAPFYPYHGSNFLQRNDVVIDYNEIFHHNNYNVINNCLPSALCDGLYIRAAIELLFPTYDLRSIGFYIEEFLFAPFMQLFAGYLQTHILYRLWDILLCNEFIIPPAFQEQLFFIESNSYCNKDKWFFPYSHHMIHTMENSQRHSSDDVSLLSYVMSSKHHDYTSIKQPVKPRTVFQITSPHNNNISSKLQKHNVLYNTTTSTSSLLHKGLFSNIFNLSHPLNSSSLLTSPPPPPPPSVGFPSTTTNETYCKVTEQSKDQTSSFKKLFGPCPGRRCMMAFAFSVFIETLHHLPKQPSSAKDIESTFLGFLTTLRDVDDVITFIERGYVYLFGNPTLQNHIYALYNIYIKEKTKQLILHQWQNKLLQRIISPHGNNNNISQKTLPAHLITMFNKNFTNFNDLYSIQSSYYPEVSTKELSLSIYPMFKYQLLYAPKCFRWLEDDIIGRLILRIDMFDLFKEPFYKENEILISVSVNDEEQIATCTLQNINQEYFIPINNNIFLFNLKKYSSYHHNINISLLTKNKIVILRLREKFKLTNIMSGGEMFRSLEASESSSSSSLSKNIIITWSMYIKTSTIDHNNSLEKPFQFGEKTWGDLTGSYHMNTEILTEDVIELLQENLFKSKEKVIHTLEIKKEIMKKQQFDSSTYTTCVNGLTKTMLDTLCFHSMPSLMPYTEDLITRFSSGVILQNKNHNNNNNAKISARELLASIILLSQGTVFEKANLLFDIFGHYDATKSCYGTFCKYNNMNSFDISPKIYETLLNQSKTKYLPHGTLAEISSDTTTTPNCISLIECIGLIQTLLWRCLIHVNNYQAFQLAAKIFDPYYHIPIILRAVLQTYKYHQKCNVLKPILRHISRICTDMSFLKTSLIENTTTHLLLLSSSLKGLNIIDPYPNQKKTLEIDILISNNHHSNHTIHRIIMNVSDTGQLSVDDDDSTHINCDNNIFLNNNEKPSFSSPILMNGYQHPPSSIIYPIKKAKKLTQSSMMKEYRKYKTKTIVCSKLKPEKLWFYLLKHYEDTVIDKFVFLSHFLQSSFLTEGLRQLCKNSYNILSYEQQRLLCLNLHLNLETKPKSTTFHEKNDTKFFTSNNNNNKQKILFNNDFINTTEQQQCFEVDNKEKKEKDVVTTKPISCSLFSLSNINHIHNNNNNNNNQESIKHKQSDSMDLTTTTTTTQQKYNNNYDTLIQNKQQDIINQHNNISSSYDNVDEPSISLMMHLNTPETMMLSKEMDDFQILSATSPTKTINTMKEKLLDDEYYYANNNNSSSFIECNNNQMMGSTPKKNYQVVDFDLPKKNQNTTTTSTTPSTLLRIQVISIKGLKNLEETPFQNDNLYVIVKYLDAKYKTQILNYDIKKQQHILNDEEKFQFHYDSNCPYIEFTIINIRSKSKHVPLAQSRLNIQKFSKDPENVSEDESFRTITTTTTLSFTSLEGPESGQIVFGISFLYPPLPISFYSFIRITVLRMKISSFYYKTKSSSLLPSSNCTSSNIQLGYASVALGDHIQTTKLTEIQNEDKIEVDILLPSPLSSLPVLLWNESFCFPYDLEQTLQFDVTAFIQDHSDDALSLELETLSAIDSSARITSAFSSYRSENNNNNISEENQVHCTFKVDLWKLVRTLGAHEAMISSIYSEASINNYSWSGELEFGLKFYNPPNPPLPKMIELDIGTLQFVGKESIYISAYFSNDSNKNLIETHRVKSHRGLSKFHNILSLPYEGEHMLYLNLWSHEENDIDKAPFLLGSADPLNIWDMISSPESSKQQHEHKNHYLSINDTNNNNNTSSQSCIIKRDVAFFKRNPTRSPKISHTLHSSLIVAKIPNLKVTLISPPIGFSSRYCILQLFLLKTLSTNNNNNNHHYSGKDTPPPTTTTTTTPTPITLESPYHSTYHIEITFSNCDFIIKSSSIVPSKNTTLSNNHNTWLAWDGYPLYFTYHNDCRLITFTVVQSRPTDYNTTMTSLENEECCNNNVILCQGKLDMWKVFETYSTHKKTLDYNIMLYSMDKESYFGTLTCNITLCTEKDLSQSLILDTALKTCSLNYIEYQHNNNNSSSSFSTSEKRTSLSSSSSSSIYWMSLQHLSDKPVVEQYTNVSTYTNKKRSLEFSLNEFIVYPIKLNDNIIFSLYKSSLIYDSECISTTTVPLWAFLYYSNMIHHKNTTTTTTTSLKLPLLDHNNDYNTINGWLYLEYIFISLTNKIFSKEHNVNTTTFAKVHLCPKSCPNTCYTTTADTCISLNDKNEYIYDHTSILELKRKIFQACRHLILEQEKKQQQYSQGVINFRNSNCIEDYYDMKIYYGEKDNQFMLNNSYTFADYHHLKLWSYNPMNQISNPIQLHVKLIQKDKCNFNVNILPNCISASYNIPALHTQLTTTTPTTLSLHPNMCLKKSKENEPLSSYNDLTFDYQWIPYKRGKNIVWNLSHKEKHQNQKSPVIIDFTETFSKKQQQLLQQNQSIKYYNDYLPKWEVRPKCFESTRDMINQKSNSSLLSTCAAAVHFFKSNVHRSEPLLELLKKKSFPNVSMFKSFSIKILEAWFSKSQRIDEEKYNNKYFHNYLQCVVTYGKHQKIVCSQKPFLDDVHHSYSKKDCLLWRSEMNNEVTFLLNDDDDDNNNNNICTHKNIQISSLSIKFVQPSLFETQLEKNDSNNFIASCDITAKHLWMLLENLSHIDKNDRATKFPLYNTHNLRIGSVKVLFNHNILERKSVSCNNMAFQDTELSSTFSISSDGTEEEEEEEEELSNDEIIHKNCHLTPMFKKESNCLTSASLQRQVTSLPTICASVENQHTDHHLLNNNNTSSSPSSSTSLPIVAMDQKESDLPYSTLLCLSNVMRKRTKSFNGKHEVKEQTTKDKEQRYTKEEGIRLNISKACKYKINNGNEMNYHFSNKASLCNKKRVFIPRLDLPSQSNKNFCVMHHNTPITQHKKHRLLIEKKFK